VKKDLRKIPEILSSCDRSTEDDLTDDPLTELKLARRQGEFHGTLNVLCDTQYTNHFSNLTKLSLYDCGLVNLKGIGMLGEHSRLEELNLGRNMIKELPPEFALLAESLKVLWLDDCEIEGTMPECIYQLINLQTLRMPGNKINNLSLEDDDAGSLSNLQQLEVLCLDGNNICDIPKDLKLPSLKSLLLRQNYIEEIPSSVFENLPAVKLLQLSSNKLGSLSATIFQCGQLEHIYINGNEITQFPSGIDAFSWSNLKHLNVSNNKMSSMPDDFIDRFGIPDPKTGLCTKDTSCKVMLIGNPLLKRTAGAVPSRSDDMDIDV